GRIFLVLIHTGLWAPSRHRAHGSGSFINCDHFSGKLWTRAGILPPCALLQPRSTEARRTARGGCVSEPFSSIVTAQACAWARVAPSLNMAQPAHSSASDSMGGREPFPLVVCPESRCPISCVRIPMVRQL